MAKVRQNGVAAETSSTSCEMEFSRPADDTLLVKLSGSWEMGNEIPSADEVRKQIEADTGIQRLAFHTKEITDWGSALLIFLRQVVDQCKQRNTHVEKEGLPKGVQRLLELASTVPEKKDARKETGRVSFLTIIGENTIAFFRSAGEMLDFIGEASVAFGKLLIGKARFRRSDLFLIIQQCGAQALPIVSLISLLVGLILGFVGAIQLQMFGAEIYVASIVGIAMVRVMGAISFIVGVGMLDLSAVEYYNMTKASVGLNNLWIGLFHSAVFGVLVALSGCLRGMQSGRSASAVGNAATSAVVTGIVSIIVATAIITVICNVLGI
jgi:ABC-type transporter Mla maintaining outer membrane lipid asymmetry permease subunit MlaE